jgi:hypothetical protein
MLRGENLVARPEGVEPPTLGSEVPKNQNRIE